MTVVQLERATVPAPLAGLAADRTGPGPGKIAHLMVTIQGHETEAQLRCPGNPRGGLVYWAFAVEAAEVEARGSVLAASEVQRGRQGSQ